MIAQLLIFKNLFPMSSLISKIDLSTQKLISTYRSNPSKCFFYFSLGLKLPGLDARGVHDFEQLKLNVDTV